MAEFATYCYYAGCGSSTPLEVKLSGRSHDPAGFELYLDGTTPVGEGQPPFQIDVSGLSAGEHTLMVQSKSFTDLTDTATLHVLKIMLEPVTCVSSGTGLILNPSGVAAGGLAMYRVDVEPVQSVPDESIRWSVACGDVRFYGDRDTGREAIIRGGSPESDFKLEVRIDGLPESCQPYIYGKVLEPKTVPVRAYIICSNGVPTVGAATINDWIAEANRIYRQVAVTFTLAGVTTVENQDWFKIDDDDEFYQMTSSMNGTNGQGVVIVHYTFALFPSSIARHTRASSRCIRLSVFSFAPILSHAFATA